MSLYEEGRHETYNKAKGEPRVGFDDRRRVVAAVEAPADEPVVAFNLLAEGVLAAGKNDTHDCG